MTKRKRKPPASGNLPKHGKDMLAAVYTSAADRLEAEGVPMLEAEERAARQAWCAVKRYYYKRSGKWIKRKDPLGPDEYPPGCKPRRAANQAGEFQKGDIVRYKGSFLRSIGRYTGVPINGMVVGFVEMGGGKLFPEVEWSDGETIHVHPANIEHDPRVQKRKNPANQAGKFQKGDIVRYKGSFLRSIGWHTGVPINGMVVGFVEMGGGKLFPEVEWSDGNTIHVHPANLEHDPRARKRKNPAEAIAASAVAYTDSLERQVDAIRSGSPVRAVEAQRKSAAALRRLKLTASQGVAVPASIGAAIGGGLGATIGAPAAAMGALLGAAAGATLGRGEPALPEEERAASVPVRPVAVTPRSPSFPEAAAPAANRRKGGRNPNAKTLRRRLMP